MFKYQKFLIGSADHFDPAAYPFLEEKIALARKELEKVPAAHRTEMLISFLMDHCINTKWEAANPLGAELINSKELPLADIEELFESAKGNVIYKNELRSYIIEQFDRASV